jgi:hypothetical protein
MIFPMVPLISLPINQDYTLMCRRKVKNKLILRTTCGIDIVIALQNFLLKMILRRNKTNQKKIERISTLTEGANVMTLNHC